MLATVDSYDYACYGWVITYQNGYIMGYMGFTIAREDVADVARAACTNDTRPVLTGVHVDLAYGSIGATDSYRAHLVRNAVTFTTGDLPDNVTLPARELARVASGPANIGEDVTFESEDGVTWTVARGDVTNARRRVEVIDVIDGQYPNLSAIMPNPDDERLGFVVLAPDDRKDDRTPFLEVVHAAARANLPNEPVTLVATGDGTVEVHWHGLSGVLSGVTSPLEHGQYVALNPSFLVDTITGTGSPSVDLMYRDELKPVSVRVGGRVRLQMPMRVTDVRPLRAVA